MRTIAKLAVAGSFIAFYPACKNREERAANELDRAQKNTTNERDNFAKQRDETAITQSDEAKARKRFVDIMDERLSAVDMRLVKEKAHPNSATDSARVAELREEASKLRARADDMAQTWNEQLRDDFVRIVHDIETELDRK